MREWGWVGQVVVSSKAYTYCIGGIKLTKTIVEIFVWVSASVAL
jgi:hypothetical protein